MLELTEYEKICTLALIHTPGVGAVTIRQLISHCGGAEKVFKSDYRKLIHIPGVGDKVARAILNKESLGMAEKEFLSCKNTTTNLHFFFDPAYPARLKSLYDSPIVLYSRGNFDFNMSRTVGIVGTRQVSDYGKSVTETIIKELEPYHVMVVSGLAFGVDITAHRACLKHNMPTIGVMASGLDVIYPFAHKKTAFEMQENGGLVTENALATKPDFMRFPARNRIIAGLSDVTIVVESARKGGSLITVEFAQNYHRDVYAVPGMLGSVHSEGCNFLIRDNKASIFTSVEDMAVAMGWEQAGDEPAEVRPVQMQASFEGFTQDESQILALLRQKGIMQVDELSWHAGMHLNKLAALLLNLEFQGMVRSLPGKKYGLI
ncbi:MULTISPECIES: DNA-processing protein DprA [Dyadobacter]|uniref:DNA-processing protein DprA n=1 Tax=Dyadobacter chenhuakuii TaxID=2909339 RepID=A0ABY4XS05_9BACT|nr:MULTISPECIES: DNA-processing protein DprA [Dyadobacter]MCF2492613.1 DNA-processing protein DprA [Dyadobacter chenhuakuii]MCF2520371.1 DNA-processing protein DprA [Dyadobacter sp. CY351]USJ33093.1 DNA-processing protein DprA [Dyadobacter chenhuakuii]